MKNSLKLWLSIFSMLSVTNALASDFDNNATPNVPYLIEAKLTASAITALSAHVGAAKYSTDYLLSANGGHSTIAYQPSAQTYNNLKPYLTNDMSISVSQYCWSDEYNVEAALATVYNNQNVSIPGTAPFQHITISFGDGKSAVDSNYLFECSADNYESYTFCATKHLHITDLTCNKFDTPLMLPATLHEA